MLRNGAAEACAQADRRIIKSWIISRSLGKPSEVWLWRQARGFSRVRPQVLCWERVDEENYPLDACGCLKLPFDPEPHEGRGRWLYRARNLPRRNFYGSVGRERRYLIDRARRDRPAVALCHFGYMGLRVLPIMERLGIPVVVHFHGLDVSSALRNRWYRWSLRRALPRFAAAVVVGGHQREKLVELGMPAPRIHLIPCGVPTDEFGPGGPREGEKLRFVCVSRLMEFKGVDYTLRAFAKVAGERPDVELVIIGDGPEREALEALARELSVSGKTRFLGSVPTQEVRHRMRASDVFLQHSLVGRNGWIEGFGVSITEAMACALPVVATDCGGITDQVVDGETGFVVKQRDTAAMVEAMARLAGDPDMRRQLGQAGRNRAVAEFDTKEQIRKLEKVLLGVARKEQDG